MPAQPCTNHPNELTYVRCGRCDLPFCVQCMIDTPVGKKCRPCSANLTHVSVSDPPQVLLALAGALAVALPLGLILQHVGFIFILAFPYGYVVGEAALRAGRRSRSLAMQVATGAAAAAGGLLGAAISMPGTGVEGAAWGLEWGRAMTPYALLSTGIGTAVAVSRVRFW